MLTNVTFYMSVQETPKFDYEMNDIKLDSVQCVKDLGVSIASNLNSPGNARMSRVRPI